MNRLTILCVIATLVAPSCFAQGTGTTPPAQTTAAGVNNDYILGGSETVSWGTLLRDSERLEKEGVPVFSLNDVRAEWNDSSGTVDLSATHDAIMVSSQTAASFEFAGVCSWVPRATSNTSFGGCPGETTPFCGRPSTGGNPSQPSEGTPYAVLTGSSRLNNYVWENEFTTDNVEVSIRLTANLSRFFSDYEVDDSGSFSSVRIEVLDENDEVEGTVTTLYVGLNPATGQLPAFTADILAHPDPASLIELDPNTTYHLRATIRSHVNWAWAGSNLNAGNVGNTASNVAFGLSWEFE